MNKKIGILATLLLSLTLILAGIHEAQAKRMGGGRSFGSKPSYSAPYQRSAEPMGSSQPIRSPAQQQASVQNQAARQGLAGRGGMMGLLGGLALGGLLGSMFFGGAFEGLNMMDFLLFAGLAFLAYKLFASRARQSQPVAGTSYDRSSHDIGGNQAPGNSSAGFNTDVLFGKGQPAAGPQAAPVAIPADFDQTSFLAGAESAYRYLQTAWDKRDLAAIRGLTTDKVFAELQDQLRATDVDNKTEVLKVNAELLEVREVGSELEATVMFDCIIREDEGATDQVREIWHFTKPVSSKQPKWYLDGIQQLQD
jgi:predicted lipid-binding transport protein (Tim44 family)